MICFLNKNKTFVASTKQRAAVPPDSVTNTQPAETGGEIVAQS